MTVIGNCSAEGCQIVNGGSCIEGFDDLPKCPNYSLDEIGDVEAVEDGSELTDQEQSTIETQVEHPPILLSSGNALTVREAQYLTAECASTVVVLMGMVKSGKTTVLAELYERFCEGTFAGHLFAGSKTIMGFEQICHLSRAASQRESEDTERTKSGIENNLLHLDLVAEDGRCRRRLLISDLSGELFEKATLASENLHTIPYLRRADHIVVFADAEKLGDPAQRHLLLNQLLVLLRCCIEESILESSCRITVVVSRHDLLPSDIDQAFLQSMQERIRERTADYFDEPTRFLDLAARPPDGPSNAYGLDQLLGGWLERPSTPEPRIPTLIEPVENAQREIDKFAFKVISDER